MPFCKRIKTLKASSAPAPAIAKLRSACARKSTSVSAIMNIGILSFMVKATGK
jgi:hypothetical protein